MSEAKSYEQEIPNGSEFQKTREHWRKQMADDEELRAKAIEIILESNKHNFGYQWEWCGVPIIRHPDDIVLQQEIMWDLKPTRVVETGIARGGSLVLSSSLMAMTGAQPRVLGLDIQILPHAIESLAKWTAAGHIKLLECDSTSNQAVTNVEEFLDRVSEPCLLILDSNHSHDHVFRELTALAPLMPVGSLVIVADTIVEEMPHGYYQNRPWDRGNNPYTATQEFLVNHPNFEIDSRWSRRSLLGECRDGVLTRRA
jgi:cephalosporin hydroxylase